MPFPTAALELRGASAKIGTIIMATGASAEVVVARFTKIGTIIMAAGASGEVVVTRFTADAPAPCKGDLQGDLLNFLKVVWDY